MAGTFPNPYATALFLALFLSSNVNISSASKPSGFSIKLIPRYSTESPLYPGNLTEIETIESMIKFSKNKAIYVKLSASPNATYDPDFFALVTRDVFYWVAQIGIGNPSLNQLLLIDTGGDLSWTQCQPCINCFHQSLPIYNSRASSTYRKLPCNHPFCDGGEDSLFTCVNDECIFSVSYGPDTGGAGPAKGIVSQESFTFPIDTFNHYTSVHNVIFGCANDNQNFDHFAANGIITGIAGLSLSPVSLFVQMQNEIEHRFSYCIVPYSKYLAAPAALRFGRDIPQLTRSAQSTPMYFVPGNYHIFLHLQDISVGNRRLNFPPGTFIQRGGATLGFIIDSGAPISQLDTNSNGINAYQIVTDAFKADYDSRRLQRFTEGQGLAFELCYRRRPGFNQYLSMTYHFENANYVLDGLFVHYFIDSLNIFCLALMPGHGVSILGATHQQNKRIVYDGAHNVIQFQNENCADDLV